jgi:hypothetical protein
MDPVRKRIAPVVRFGILTFETRVSPRYSHSASPCADPGSKFIRIHLAALLERDLLILRGS